MEVSNSLQVSVHQLRYLEKTFPTFSVNKIKGRRHYTDQNIEFLQKHFLERKEYPSINHQSILQKVEHLINKFNNILQDSTK